MILGIFHDGSGLGDQLFRYITVRSLALDKGYDWGMISSENFKGDFFIEFDKGNKPDQQDKEWTEKDVRDEHGNDIRSYDPEINFVEDGTVIEGSFEDDKYWGHHMGEIADWLITEPLEVPDTKCVIGFRGGEYASMPELFLTKDYWYAALTFMKEKEIEVHTDDPPLAKQVFPGARIIDNEKIAHSKHTNMGFNWRSARNAKYAIIPNSAFFILPRLLKHHEDPEAVTIAPRGWARRNTKTWARPACYYSCFQYI